MKTRSKKSLMQKALDGALDDQEMQTWQTHLKQHPDSQAIYDEQAGMTRLLHQVQEVEPPPHLTQSILRRVRNRKADYRTSWHKMKDLHVRDFFLRPACSFAAGLTLGLLLLAVTLRVASDNEPENSFVSGTIATVPGEHHFEAIELDNIRGQIHWISQPNRIEVQLKLMPSNPATIQFRALEDNLTLTAFRGIKLREIQELSLTPDKLEFEVVKACNLTLDFSSVEERPSPFHLQIFQSGQLCYNKIIQ